MAMQRQRLLMLLSVLVFLLLANHAGVNNGQIVYASPPPPPSVICTTCDTCENPCTPVVPASPPPPSPPPPAIAQNECPPPPDTYVYPYSPPPPVKAGTQYPYYPYYTISRSAPLVNHGSALFFLVSPLILILSLWFSFLTSSRIVHTRYSSPLRCWRSRHHLQMGKSVFKLSFDCCWLIDADILRSAISETAETE